MGQNSCQKMAPDSDEWLHSLNYYKFLRESEANSNWLPEQAKGLKDEIRRLERNQEKEEESANLECLKKSCYTVLEVSSERARTFGPGSTMLKLSQEEKNLVIRQARGELNDENSQQQVVLHECYKCVPWCKKRGQIKMFNSASLFCVYQRYQTS